MMWTNLEDEFSRDSLAQVQSSVNDHGAELDEQHHQKRFRHLVFWQRGRYISCCTVFLKQDKSNKKAFLFYSI